MAFFNALARQQQADPAYQAAWARFNPQNMQGGISPELVKYLSNGGHNYSPDGRYQLSPQYGGDPYNGGDGILKGFDLWDKQTSGAGKPYQFYDPTGKWQQTLTGSTVSLKDALIPAAAALGMAAFLPGVAGAGATTGGATVGGTAGGFVGEGALSGVGAWDGALAGAGGTTGMGAAGAAGAAGAGSGAGGVASTVGKALGGFSWDSLIGPATSLVGGAINAGAAKSAAGDQLTAAREAAAMFEPWRQAGSWSIGQAANMLGKNGQQAATAAFQQDPGYQWRVSQGENALTRAAAARGLMGSGKFLKDAMRFNQGEASQEFGNSLNRLLAVAGMGQTATGSSADYTTQGANASAAGKVGSANAWGNALTQGVGMYQNNQLMNRLLPGYR